MQLPLRNADGQAAKSGVELDDSAFAAEYNETLIHQVVTAYMAGARSGTRAQKSRSDARGGGAKPWAQKGTGRARAGTIRSPLWRGGGVTFAARPQDHSQKVNRKMYRSALRSILSELARKERLLLVEEFTVEQPKTKELVAKLKKMGLTEVLIVKESEDENLALAARNLYRVGVCGTREVDPVSLVAFDKVLITVPALKQLEERLR